MAIGDGIVGYVGRSSRIKRVRMENNVLRVERELSVN